MALHTFHIPKTLSYIYPVLISLPEITNSYILLSILHLLLRIPIDSSKVECLKANFWFFHLLQTCFNSSLSQSMKNSFIPISQDKNLRIILSSWVQIILTSQNWYHLTISIVTTWFKPSSSFSGTIRMISYFLPLNSFFSHFRKSSL